MVKKERKKRNPLSMFNIDLKQKPNNNTVYNISRLIRSTPPMANISVSNVQVHIKLWNAKNQMKLHKFVSYVATTNYCELQRVPQFSRIAQENIPETKTNVREN
ncbi:hypothetical protein M0804_009132 [Polistes exclamans]|nr:hypothetical protein M0804_009132 [Polistes exclamans]